MKSLASIVFRNLFQSYIPVDANVFNFVNLVKLFTSSQSCSCWQHVTTFYLTVLGFRRFSTPAGIKGIATRICTLLCRVTRETDNPLSHGSSSGRLPPRSRISGCRKRWKDPSLPPSTLPSGVCSVQCSVTKYQAVRSPRDERRVVSIQEHQNTK